MRCPVLTNIVVPLDTLVIKQQYDANASIKNMNTVKGTVFELVLKKPIYWILCAFHYLVWFLKGMPPILRVVVLSVPAQ